jgi:hypothetical protein
MRKQPLSRATLGIMRKLGICAFILFISGLGLGAFAGIALYNWPSQVEIALTGLAAGISGLVALVSITSILRYSLPTDLSMRRKIRENYWFAGPIGLLLSILFLTKDEGAARP